MIDKELPSHKKWNPVFIIATLLFLFFIKNYIKIPPLVSGTSTPSGKEKTIQNQSIFTTFEEKPRYRIVYVYSEFKSKGISRRVRRIESTKGGQGTLVSLEKKKKLFQFISTLSQEQDTSKALGKKAPVQEQSASVFFDDEESVQGISSTAEEEEEKSAKEKDTTLLTEDEEKSIEDTLATFGEENEPLQEQEEREASSQVSSPVVPHPQVLTLRSVKVAVMIGGRRRGVKKHKKYLIK
ncbi:hypothetical protein K501DRAFT_274443 [Backusella circina FSU 941]|nr:hypothetical protein K501DRAFT_274443 [Backusella circina FSU 941]